MDAREKCKSIDLRVVRLRSAPEFHIRTSLERQTAGTHQAAPQRTLDGLRAWRQLGGFVDPHSGCDARPNKEAVDEQDSAPGLSVSMNIDHSGPWRCGRNVRVERARNRDRLSSQFAQSPSHADDLIRDTSLRHREKVLVLAVIQDARADKCRPPAALCRTAAALCRTVAVLLHGKRKRPAGENVGQHDAVLTPDADRSG